VCGNLSYIWNVFSFVGERKKLSLCIKMLDILSKRLQLFFARSAKRTKRNNFLELYITVFLIYATYIDAAGYNIDSSAIVSL
jgi:hypothetical protein